MHVHHMHHARTPHAPCTYTTCTMHVQERVYPATHRRLGLDVQEGHLCITGKVARGVRDLRLEDFGPLLVHVRLLGLADQVVNHLHSGQPGQEKRVICCQSTAPQALVLSPGFAQHLCLASVRLLTTRQERPACNGRPGAACHSANGCRTPRVHLVRL